MYIAYAGDWFDFGDKDLLLVGRFSFRRPDILRSAIMMLVGAIVLGLGGARFASYEDGAWATALFLLSGILLVVAADNLWRWLVKHVVTLRFDSAGVKYGKERWSWDELAEIRFVTSLRSDWEGIALMTKRDGKQRGLGGDLRRYRVLQLDAVTDEQRCGRVRRVEAFCRAHAKHLRVA